MKVEIWSDVMCPFCYIGKRKFEKALEQFHEKNEVEVVWHSFQLDPTLEHQHGKNLYDYVAERKGQTREWSQHIHRQVIGTAREVGLTYNFDKAIVANSFDAHRLIQLAKKHHIGDQAEERIFRAYFTEGKDVADHETLVELGKEIGLDAAVVSAMLQSDEYADEVRNDCEDAAGLGATGVPFFVFNRRYAVAGAQPTEVFSEVLEKSFTEWRKDHPIKLMNVPSGEVCTTDGACN
jgi:predicted DsbA family dithiol-disulfide isomerase